MCDAQLSASVVSAILPGRQIFRSSQPFKSTRIPAVQKASGQSRAPDGGDYEDTKEKRHKKILRNLPTPTSRGAKYEESSSGKDKCKCTMLQNPMTMQK